MVKSNSARNYSNDHLGYDVLVQIFVVLNVVDLARASLVCKSWYQASRDQTFWHKIDLTALSTSTFNIPRRLYTRMDRTLSSKVTKFLKYALSLSDGITRCLIFNYYMYLTDAHLLFVATRTPNLKRLVLPLSVKLTKSGIYSAMKLWGELESITMTSMARMNGHIFSAIGEYSMKITELKFTCHFGKNDAEVLVKYTPNLKILSLRNIFVNKRGLCRVLNDLEHLEMVNICHSLIVGDLNDQFKLYSIDDLQNHLSISCLRKLISCPSGRCLMCKNEHYNGPGSKVYSYSEDIWLEDEITCLAH